MVAKSYLFLISTFIAWAVFRVIAYISSNLELVLYAERWSYVVGLLIAWTFLNFTSKFPYQKIYYDGLFRTIALVLTTVLIMYSLYARGLVVAVNVIETDKTFTMSPVGITIYNLTFIVIFAVAFSQIIRKYKQAAGDQKVQLRWVIMSTLIAVIGGLVCNLIFIQLGIFSYQVFGPSFTLPFTLTVSYLILRARK